MGELLNTYNLVNAIEVGNYIQPYFGTLIFELAQEERQQMLNCAEMDDYIKLQMLLAVANLSILVLSEDRRQSHDDRSQGRLHVLVGIHDKILDTWKDVGHDDGLLDALV